MIHIPRSNNQTALITPHLWKLTFRPTEHLRSAQGHFTSIKGNGSGTLAHVSEEDGIK